MRRTDPAWLTHSRRGSGPPLVLIHGIGSRWQVWEPVLDEVARHRDVIALDLPGFGASPPWPDPTSDPGSVDHLADRVVAFLGALGIRRPAVAGSSLGGGIALELGRRGLAREITAFSPIGFWGPLGRRWCQAAVGGARSASVGLRPVLPRLFATAAGRVAFCGLFYGHPGRLAPDECVDSAEALADAPGFAAARAAFGRWQLHNEQSPAHDRRPHHRVPGALAAMPVTIAWGTRDLVLPYRSQARRARAALPAARHVALPGCGHLPFADDPAACARLLIETY
ncbi:alpha/beta fold hydrolase [Micromonospora sp. GCM10011542]|uniref:alpha/beta fold hydrolase n=1 Tax=Micromonospora sp. GCM10011542 TaxID=3317337 RepID=UPI0036076367